MRPWIVPLVLGVPLWAATLFAVEQEPLVIVRKPTTAQRLWALCSGKDLPSNEVLLEAYLERQWERMIGIGEPSPNLKFKTAPLDEKEQKRLLAWFREQPTLRHRLLSALNPMCDDVRAGARVALALREKVPQAGADFERLVAAYATVWDHPAAAKNEGIQTSKPCTFEESFSWFVKNRKQLAPWFLETPPKLLVPAAASVLSLDERAWVQQKYNYSRGMGNVYSTLFYDQKKLKGVTPQWIRDGKPYTLQNLFKFGGICEDQAYFAKEVCISQGVPAWYITGETNAGVSHAWVGWIDRDSNGYVFLEHGRFPSDNIRLGALYDARTGGEAPSNFGELEARMWSDEAACERAELCVRLSAEFGADLAGPKRVRLLQHALKERPCHREAWLALSAALGDGHLPKSEAAELWERAERTLTDCPDTTCAVLRGFARAFPEARDQNDIFEKSWRRYRDEQRRDLAGRLRIDQIDFLLSKKKLVEAAEVALATLEDCAGESSITPDLTRRYVDICRNLKQLDRAAEPVKTAASRLPILRAFQINTAWLETQELLRDLYIEMSQPDLAFEIQGRIDNVSKNLSSRFGR